MPFTPGQRIGRIRVEELLGAGGMSEVYRGFDEVLERPVALKVVGHRRRLSPLAKSRFMREARILSRLDHPGICKVFDLVGGDDADVLVLELVEGITLRQAMDRGLAYEEKLEIAEQLAAALAAAHGLGIIHRDFKPTNVMRTPGGVVKVLDFDLARFVTEGDPAPDEPAVDAPDGESTDAGTIVGTAAYMSPEQARGEPLTVASDLYTLGIMLHELFLGDSPYGEERPLRARLLQVASGETEPARGLDPELTSLVESLKRAEPTARPPAAEVVRQLHALRMEPIRHRRLLLLAAAALVAGLVLAIPVAHKLASERPLAAAGTPVRVAVERFSNLTGTPAHDWVESGLAELLKEALASLPDLEAVAGQDAAPDLEVAASIASVAGHYRVQLTLLSTAGKPEHWETEVGWPAEAAAAVARRVAERSHGAVDQLVLARSLPRDPYTTTFCGIGLDLQARGEAAQALRYLELCVEREPDLAWARLRLAAACAEVGSLARAVELARAAERAARSAGQQQTAERAARAAEQWAAVGDRGR